MIDAPVWIESELPVPGQSRQPGEPGGLDPSREYSRERVPLVSYGALVALYNLAFLLVVVAARRSARGLPPRFGWGDVVLLGTATFKLSRLVAKDRVTSFLRAPFAVYEGPAGESEVNEKPRGEGMQRAIGELITCPFCVGAWAAALLAYGLLLSPPVTRLAASILALLAVSDFLQFAYADAST